MLVRWEENQVSVVTWKLYECARAAITNYYRLSDKQQKLIFLQFSGLEVQDQGVGRFAFS